jgi:hypothetical protein
MCECLKEIRKNIEKSGDYPNAKLMSSNQINMKARVGEPRFRETAGTLEITYNKKKKDGSISKKKEKVNMLYTHCPFCGEKY